MIPTPEQKEECISVLQQMAGLLGFAVDVAATEDKGQFALHLKANDPGRLIGRKGHYLQSLELLLNRILRKKFDRIAWVEVDVDGYQKKTKRRSQRSSEEVARLEQMAMDAAKEVKKWGQPKQLGPFAAHDRRIIHVALAADHEVCTESEPGGAQGIKKVVIRLADRRQA